MTCAKRKERLYIKVERKWRRVYFVSHDPDLRTQVFVVWPKTRHMSRVPRASLRRRRRRH